MLATSMKLAGYSTLSRARLMVTIRSSMGWRITSSTVRLNSGSSSRKRTPLWASEISPGWGWVPPPTSPASVSLLRIVQEIKREYYLVFGFKTDTYIKERNIKNKSKHLINNSVKIYTEYFNL